MHHLTIYRVLPLMETMCSRFTLRQTKPLYAHAKVVGPTLLNCDTYRFRGHHIGDPGTSYRDREEVQEQERQRDPIRRLTEVLTEEEGVSQDELTALEAELAKELEAALEFAKNSPEPLPEDALNDLYAGSIQP